MRIWHKVALMLLSLLTVACDCGTESTAVGDVDGGVTMDASTGDGSTTEGSRCESSSECDGPTVMQCCPDGMCPVGRCVSGVEPPPACADRAPGDTCTEGFACVDDDCGRGACQLDCRVAGDCAARGLDCTDDACVFDCTLPGYAGCSDGTVCRANGRCGVPPCAAGSCGPQEDCMDVSAGSEFDDGCRAKNCSAGDDCPSGGFCIDGRCSEVPGVCSELLAVP